MQDRTDFTFDPVPLPESRTDVAEPPYTERDGEMFMAGVSAALVLIFDITGMDGREAHLRFVDRNRAQVPAEIWGGYSGSESPQ